MMLWLATTSASLYADRSNFNNLYAGGGFVTYIRGGVIGSHDPFIFYVPPYPGHSFYSPCYPFATCAAFHRYQLDMKRKERFQRLRDQSEQRALEMSSSSLLQSPESYRTDEKEIRPGFRGYSQIRPEYSGTGKYLPEFLEEIAPKAGK